jgi:hypothetical protein
MLLLSRSTQPTLVQYLLGRASITITLDGYSHWIPSMGRHAADSITALPEPAPRPSRPIQLWAGILTELLPDRPYPLEVTTWGPQLLVSAVLAPMFRILGVVVRLDRSIVEEDGVVVRFTDQFPFRPTPRILLAPLRLLRLARRYDPARWRSDPLLLEVQTRVRALEARDLQALSWPGLLDTVHKALAIPHLVGQLRIRYLLPRMPAVGGLRLMLTLLRAGDRFGTLLFTGVESRTVEANRALEALATRIRSDPELADAFARHEAGELMPVLEAQLAGRAFLAELRTFLDEYGHREAGATLQISQSTWKDAPEVVLGILKGLAAAPPRVMVERPAWEAARDELFAHTLSRIPPLRAAFLGLLAEARWFPQIREDTRFYATLILPVLWRTLLEFGRRLADTGVLDLPEDVFHLKLDELERIDGTWPPPPQLAGELRALVTRRKAKRAELKGTPLVDPRLFRQAEVNGNMILRGIPGSPGVAEGTVRIVHDASKFGKLRTGEVLVAPYTNPAWTPLFQRAVAVVVDSGGAGSHAAIVARISYPGRDGNYRRYPQAVRRPTSARRRRPRSGLLRSSPDDAARVAGAAGLTEPYPPIQMRRTRSNVSQAEFVNRLLAYDHRICSCEVFPANRDKIRSRRADSNRLPLLQLRVCLSAF